MMQKAAEIIFKENKFFLMGHLDFANVVLVYKQSILELKKHSHLKFDFSLLKSSNSAIYALIVEWIKFAKRHRKSISFENLSEDLLSIAKIADLDKLLSKGKRK